MKLSALAIIFVSALIGLLACSYLFVFKPANLQQVKLAEDIKQKQVALSNLNQATLGINDLNNKISDLQKAIDFFESKLPQEKEVGPLLEQISKMAEANSLLARTVRTLKIERSNNYSELPLQLSLAGDFNGFYAFLLQLEKLPRITRVTQMKLEKIDGHDGEMEAEMTLRIFFEPDNTATASVQ